jgi:hypothetical protein
VEVAEAVATWQEAEAISAAASAAALAVIGAVEAEAPAAWQQAGAISAATLAAVLAVVGAVETADTQASGPRLTAQRTPPPSTPIYPIAAACPITIAIGELSAITIKPQINVIYFRAASPMGGHGAIPAAQINRIYFRSARPSMSRK